MTRHVVNELSLVFVWRGRAAAPGQEDRRGVMLMAHMDVVPVPDADEWEFPPFGGVITGGGSGGDDEKAFVVGRGAIDDKQAVIAICAAAEAMLERGQTPAAPFVVLSFGHDEELSGFDGARAIAAELPRILAAAGLAANPGGDGRPLAFVLDEGLFLLEGGAASPFPGHEGRVAIVCVGEKGHLTVELTVEADAGHSSAPPVGPPPHTALGRLARAVARVEAAPFAAHAHPASALYEALLPGVRAPLFRLVYANLWLTWPLVRAAQLARPAGAAMLRTTTAATMARAGFKANVLPPLATAVVNHRIHPAESCASVLAHDRAAVADARVRVEPFDALEPAPVSSTTSAGFRAICGAVRGVFGAGVTTAPGLMLGNTDTRWLWPLARDIYRHCPTELRVRGEGDGVVGTVAMFHGRDERISVANLARLCAFYATVMSEATGE